MQERNALFRELTGLGLYQSRADNEVTIDPTDTRIDVRAKFSLQRMLKQGGDAAADAEGMITAINTGQLAGIDGDDTLRAVKVAKQLGIQRWLLVPKGKDAELVKVPAGPPSIIFREGLEKDTIRMDMALRTAWKSFSKSVILPKYPVLRYGDKGLQVKYLQSILNKIFTTRQSYTFSQKALIQNRDAVPVLTIDGIFGLSTEQAVIAFQQSRNLIPNGIVGNETWDELLKKALPGSPILKGETNREFYRFTVTCKVDIGLCVTISGCDFMFNFSCKEFVLPAGQPGEWKTGFIQNVISEELSVKYLLDDPLTYKIPTQLLDTNVSSPFAASNYLGLKNPQIDSSDGSRKTVTIDSLGYKDSPSIIVDFKKDGNPANALESLERKLVFRTYIVSQSPSGQFFVLAFSEPFTQIIGTTRIQQTADRIDYVPICRFEPELPNFTIVDINTTTPLLVTKGPLSNTVARGELKKLKINTGACA